MWETFLSPDNLTYMLKGAGASLALALGALFFGVIIGIIMAAMKLSKSKILNVIGTVYVEILRGTPCCFRCCSSTWVFRCSIR